MYCKDCKHWEYHEDNWGGKWHECGAVDSDKQAAGDVKDADFVVYAEAHDDSGMQSGLKTGPLFGCIKFQAKEVNFDGNE